MPRILNDVNFNTPVQKVVETAEGVIINGQYYDKNTLTPKPFKFMPTFGDVEDISMSRKTLLRWNVTAATNLAWSKSYGDLIVRDNNDPTIVYVPTVRTRTNLLTMLKLKEDNGKVETLFSITYPVSTPGASPFITQYCGQNDTHLFYIIATSTSVQSYFVRIDKATLAINTITAFSAYSTGSLMKETPEYIYYVIRRFGSSSMVRYNKLTGVSDNVTSFAARPTTLYVQTITPEPFHVAPNEAYTFSVFHSPAQARMVIVRHKMDFTKSGVGEIVTEAEAAITWGAITTALPLLNTTVAGTHIFRYEPFITKVGDKRYLNVYVYENLNNTTSANLPVYGFYTFLITPTYDLEFKAFTHLGDVPCRGFLGVRENTMLVTGNANSAIFLNFNSATERFQITDSLNTMPTHIGLDQSENIWTISSNGEVDVLSPFVPTNIDLKYEKELYRYDGFEIPTYATIEAKNYLGQNIECDIELTISGNALFSPGQTKKVTERTSATGPKIVNLNFTGAGAITIHPRLIM